MGPIFTSHGFHLCVGNSLLTCWDQNILKSPRHAIIHYPLYLCLLFITTYMYTLTKLCSRLCCCSKSNDPNTNPTTSINTNLFTTLTFIFFAQKPNASFPHLLRWSTRLHIHKHAYVNLLLRALRSLLPLYHKSVGGGGILPIAEWRRFS